MEPIKLGKFLPHKCGTLWKCLSAKFRITFLGLVYDKEKTNKYFAYATDWKKKNRLRKKRTFFQIEKVLSAAREAGVSLYNKRPIEAPLKPLGTIVM